MTRSSILVTGASGFVGGAVLARLRYEGRIAVGVARCPPAADGWLMGPPLGAGADWQALVRGRDVVVHAAARVHVMRESVADPAAAFHAANVAGTLALGRQAAAAGVRRFVFISSIKVNGEASLPGRPFRADDMMAPVDAYGVSKRDAEVALLALSKETGMEVTIVRPPLVYGPGVQANFLSMMRWLRRGVPLPFGAVTENRRSLVGLDNLVDLIRVCIDHPAAANQTFLVSDGEDVSTAELLRRLARAMGVHARLVPLPVWVLEAAVSAFGGGALIQRLCGNLQVDSTQAGALLGWRPPFDLDEGLRRAAGAFRR